VADLVVRLGIPLFLIGVLVSIGFNGRNIATRDVARLAGHSLQDTVTSQQAALSGLSKNAQQLLSSLEATERGIQTSRRELAETLAGLAQHERAAAASLDSLKEVRDRESLIRMQVGQLQQALGGQQPITRVDLERSQNSGLLVGSLIGLLTGICGQFAYDWIKSGAWRVRRTLPSSSAPPDGDGKSKSI
jgi:hypothetical protein